MDIDTFGKDVCACLATMVTTNICHFDGGFWSNIPEPTLHVFHGFHQYFYPFLQIREFI